MYNKIKIWVRNLFSFLAVAILGQFAINIATEIGWLSDTPLKDLGQAMSSITNWAYWTQAVWFILGVSVWSWLEWGLRKVFKPSMLRQFVDDQLYENALSLASVELVSVDGNLETGRLEFHNCAHFKNDCPYGIYIRLGTPFFSIAGRVHQDYTLEDEALFLKPGEEYEMNIPPVGDVEFAPKLVGRYAGEIYFGLEPGKYEMKLIFDCELVYTALGEGEDTVWRLMLSISDKKRKADQ